MPVSHIGTWHHIRIVQDEPSVQVCCIIDPKPENFRMVKGHPAIPSCVESTSAEINGNFFGDISGF